MENNRINCNEIRDSALVTDLYELTMMQGYWKEGKHQDPAVFDLFYRKAPYGWSFVIASGINDALNYTANVRFADEDLEYLRSINTFDEEFLEYLKTWRFTGDIHGVSEGEVVPPNIPIIRISAPLIEAQAVETALLNKINFQSLIATKACRIVYAAENCPVIDFGLRRAQGLAHLEATRACIVGGVQGTSNVLGGKVYGVPVKGTHAHSWVQSFPSEIEAFRAYAHAFPKACLFLVDTYDTLNIGVPNAVAVAREFIDQDPEFKFLGIRIDSGDLAYLSAKADEMLSKAGFGPDVKIVLSNDLDEHVIQSIIQQIRRRGAPDAVKRLVFGVGTMMVTGSPEPALGGVYKLVEYDGIPKIKISSNVEKLINPGRKEVVRIYGRDGPMGDVLVIEDDMEDFITDLKEDPTRLQIFHPTDKYKTYRFKPGDIADFHKLYKPLMLKGDIVDQGTWDIMSLQKYAKTTFERFDHSYKRFNNPHIYKVSLHENLWKLKQQLIEEGLSQAVK
jgi:nicotinate phosphoribosyltransferase